MPASSSSAFGGSGTSGLGRCSGVSAMGGRAPASSSIGSTSTRKRSSSTITVACRTRLSRRNGVLAVNMPRYQRQAEARTNISFSILLVKGLRRDLAAARAPQLHREVVAGVAVERHEREAVLDQCALVGGRRAELRRGHHAVLRERHAP